MNFKIRKTDQIKCLREREREEKRREENKRIKKGKEKHTSKSEWQEWKWKSVQAVPIVASCRLWKPTGVHHASWVAKWHAPLTITPYIKRRRAGMKRCRFHVLHHSNRPATSYAKERWKWGSLDGRGLHMGSP